MKWNAHWRSTKVFDEVTARLLGQAPKLRGVTRSRLAPELADAYVQTAVGSVAGAGLKSTAAFDRDRILGIARAQEAMALSTADSAERVAAAFAAARSYHTVSIADGDDGSQFTASSIPARFSAMLLYLVAGAIADAQDLSRNFESDDTPIAGTLARVLEGFCQGKLLWSASIEAPRRTVPETHDPHEFVATLAYRELTDALQSLALRLNEGAAVDWDPQRFSTLRSRLEASASSPGLKRATDVVAAGPWHLALLLERVGEQMLQSSVLAVASPSGVSEEPWNHLLKRIAVRRPTLWQNHRSAIAQGLLEPGISAVVSFPTGAGKSTVSELKIGATLLSGRRVIVLAPTLSLLAQAARAMRNTFPDAALYEQDRSLARVTESDSGSADILVLTPETCLAMLGVNPATFDGVGLIHLDEAHILHGSVLGRSRRALDSMLCLLTLVALEPCTDLLLSSAMIANAHELADWITGFTSRPCLALDDRWKPTRQARGVVVYRSDEIGELNETMADVAKGASTKGYPAARRGDIAAQPYGLFGLQPTWESLQRRDYRWLPLLDRRVALTVSGDRPDWWLTANANNLAANLASACAEAGKKTLVFVPQVRWAVSTSREMNTVNAVRTRLSVTELALKDRASRLAGGDAVLYGVFEGDEAVGESLPHHGLLLEEERRLHERMYQRPDGIPVLVATSTLAQGMNLPSEVVVIAGDRRFDASANRAELLEAQELLNAAGRAGRAGHTSSGLVIVIPSRPIHHDGHRKLSKGWGDLRAVFSHPDQCVSVADPIAAVLDSDDDASAERDYLGRKLAAMNPDDTSNFFRSSLAHFQSRPLDDAELEGRFIQLVKTRSSDAPPWALAATSITGWKVEDVLSIGDRLSDAPLFESIAEAIAWVTDCLRDQPLLLETILREGSRAIFKGAPEEMGPGWERLKGLQLVEAVAGMLAHWLRGATLFKLESEALRLGLVKAATPRCEFARRFVLRVVPDLAFIFGAVQTIAVWRELQVADSPLRLAAAAVELGVSSEARLEYVRENPARTRIDANDLLE